MGFLDRLFGKKEVAPTVEEKPVEPVEIECPHSLLTPHWENMEDFGKHELISFYVCDTCAKRFTPEERADVEASSAEAAHEIVEIDESLRRTAEEQAAYQAEEEKHMPWVGEKDDKN